jgi:hypothetical protein
LRFNLRTDISCTFVKLIAETHRVMQRHMLAIRPIQVVLFHKCLDVNVLTHPSKTALRTVNAPAARNHENGLGYALLVTSGQWSMC